MTSKLHGRVAVQDVNQCPTAKVAEWPVEETWPDGAVRLDYRRYPRRIAAGRAGRDLPKLGAKVQTNTAQLCRAFADEARIDLILAFANQVFDFPRKILDLDRIQRNIGPARYPATASNG